MHEEMSEEEKKEAILFYDNYRAVIRTINELEKGADESDLNKLKSYKKQLEGLIIEMAHYSKTFYNQNDYTKSEDYRSASDVVARCREINYPKIDCHNRLILKIHAADLICAALGRNLLFGKFGDYSQNIDCLIQKREEKIEDAPAAIRIKRIEIFRWAHNMVLLSLSGNKSKNHADFVGESEDLVSISDLFKLLSEGEIYETLVGKLNR